MSRRKLAFWAVAFGVGAYLGYRIAYGLGQTDFQVFGAITAGILAVTILVILAVFAVVGWFTPGKGGRPAARAVIVAGVLLAVGVGVGWAITPVLGLGYRDGVVLEAPATMTLSLTGLDGYAGKADAPATCRSEVDKEAVAFVEANAVGTVGTDAVTAYVSIATSDRRPEVVVSIVPAIKGEAAVPAWQGTADVLERTDGDRSGRLAFTVTLIASGEVGSQPEGWPAELSGTMSWSCGEWTNAQP